MWFEIVTNLEEKMSPVIVPSITGAKSVGRIFIDRWIPFLVETVSLPVGRNSVLELLESERDINKILIAKGERHGSINKIIAIAKQRKIVIAEVERQKLNAISETNNHHIKF